MIQKFHDSSQLPVNPSVLLWAREQSGFSLERVAKKLNVKTNRVLSWERGQLAPTFRQTQELARAYHRPFNLFFLSEPPQLPPLSAEYRRLPGVVPGQESPELRLAVRQMSLRREHASNLFSELSGDVPSFKMKAHLNEEPQTIA